MYGFIVVLVFLFLGFTLISVKFDRGEALYGDLLYATFRLQFGSYDDSSYGVFQKLLTAFIVFLLNVVLLNMLISIMAASFERVQDEIALNDSLTRLDTALEAMVYMRSASLLLKKKTRNREEGYLIYCEPDDMDEDASKEDVWEDRINMIKETMKQNQLKAQERFEVLENKVVQGIINTAKIDSKMVQVDTKIVDMEKKVSGINAKLDQLQKDMAAILNYIKPPQAQAPPAAVETKK